jgi:hypothetical protein
VDNSPPGSFCENAGAVT